MQKATFSGDKQIIFIDSDMPETEDDKLVIRVRACGISSQEKTAYLDGQHKAGKEIAGTIHHQNSSLNFSNGDRVAVYSPLHRQPSISNFIKAHPKSDSIEYPHGFAENIILSEEDIIPIPDAVEMDTAVLLLDTFGTPSHGLRMANAENAKSACVIGCGLRGLSSIFLLKAWGVENIIAIGNHPFRLRKAHEMGVDIVDYSTTDAVEYVNTFIGGADIIVFTPDAGFPFESSKKLLKKDGVIVVLLHSKEDDGYDLWKDESVKTIVAWYFTKEDYLKNIEMYLNGQLDGCRSFISHKFPLEKLQEACDKYYFGQCMKVIVEP